MMTADVYGFLNQFPDESYDIRVTKDARYVDQKCTPDIVCFIADCNKRNIRNITNNSK